MKNWEITQAAEDEADNLMTTFHIDIINLLIKHNLPVPTTSIWYRHPVSGKILNGVILDAQIDRNVGYYNRLQWEIQDYETNDIVWVGIEYLYTNEN